MEKSFREFRYQLNHEYQQLQDVQHQHNLNPSEFQLNQNLLNFIHEEKIPYHFCLSLFLIPWII